MSYHCEILADTENALTGDRLTSFLVTFPRMVLADLTRHRVMSFSFESTRAIPVAKRIEMIESGDFFVPRFREASKGMQQGAFLAGARLAEREKNWRRAAKDAAYAADCLLDVEKGITGRLLEPFSWITGIISGTEWENFFVLRADPRMGAQYEAQVITGMMRDAREASQPYVAETGEWHLPLIEPEEFCPSDQPPPEQRELAEASAGRCAAISYLNHRNNESIETSRDRWIEKLQPFSHWSPAEHPAQVAAGSCTDSNYRGFTQLRKMYPGNEVASV